MISLDTESGICYNKCCTTEDSVDSGTEDRSEDESVNYEMMFDAELEFTSSAVVTSSPYTSTSRRDSGCIMMSASTRSSCNGSGGSRRKQNRWDQPEPTHSHGSLLSSMERFVQTVEDMNETILVPCRLMDVKFDHNIIHTAETDSTGNGVVPGKICAAESRIDKAAAGKRLIASLNGTDLFQFYSMLNTVKNNLMWGTHGQNQNQPRPTSIQASAISTSSSASSVVSSSASSTSSLSQVSQGQSSEVKGHARRPSTVSTTSSTSASDTEFSELNEDSGVEAEQEEEYSHSMADTFHHHLNGLQQCLCDLTLAADYVTARYNNDLGENL